MRYVIEVECNSEQDKYILSCCEQDIRSRLEGVTSSCIKTYDEAWVDGNIKGKIEGYTDGFEEGINVAKQHIKELIIRNQGVMKALDKATRRMCNSCNMCDLNDMDVPIFKPQVCDAYIENVSALKMARVGE